ncbi:MAG: hypothetical protein RR798_01975 [Malacoplasma sp.]
MKLKKNFNKKIFACAGFAVVGFSAPLFLTSCTPGQNLYAKIIDINTKMETYTALPFSNVSLYDAIYGANFNNGNYIFIYGTTGSPSFREYAYGRGNDNSGSNATINEQNFSTSAFLINFFNKGNIGNGLLPKDNVKILTYMDLDPYNPNAKSEFPEDNDGLTPFETWTQEQVLQLANKGSDRYDIKTLPNEFKFKIGTYKRYDDSAIQYRSTIEFLLKIRPSITGVGSDNKSGGLIAFKKDKNPATYELAQASVESISAYYQNK